MAEEFNKQPACLNTDKYITCTVLIEKEVKIIDENGEEILKIYPTDYILLIAQYLWRVHCQILSIIKSCQIFSRNS